jgi:hypothetical protein
MRDNMKIDRDASQAVDVQLSRDGARLLAILARSHRLERDHAALTGALDGVGPSPLLARRSGRWHVNGAPALGRSPVGLGLLEAAMRGPVPIAGLVPGKHGEQAARRQRRDALAWARRHGYDDLARQLERLAVIDGVLQLRP